MKIKIFLFIIYIFSAYSFNLRRAKEEISYDSYVFALQWPNGYCAAYDSCEILNKTEKNIFTIHGLWPNLKNGKRLPECTSGETINADLSGLSFYMNKYWPSFKGSNKDFWLHEYNKHGYCMVKEKNWDDSKHYFSFVIKLYLQRYRFLLQKAFGNQSRIVELDTNELKSKIQKVMPGINFKLKCEKNYITEFQFYLEKDLTPNTNTPVRNPCTKAKLVFK